jgi:hypothetical protein
MKMLNLNWLFVYIGLECVLELNYTEDGCIGIEYDGLKNSISIKAKDRVCMEYHKESEIAIVYIYEAMDSKEIIGTKIYLRG